MSREKRKWKPHKSESTEAGHRGGVTRSSEEGPVMGLERRGGPIRPETREQLATGGFLELGKAFPHQQTPGVGSLPRVKTRVVGYPEVQAHARAPTAGGTLAAGCGAPPDRTIRALAITVWTGWVGRAG